MLYTSFRNKLWSLRLVTKYHVKFSTVLPLTFDLIHSIKDIYFLNSTFSTCTYFATFSNSSENNNNSCSNVKPPNAFKLTPLDSADSAPHQTESLPSGSKTHEAMESVGTPKSPLAYPHPYPPLDPREVEERFICGSGPGGQKINKRHNCVVLRHIATGITVQCQETREMQENRRLARLMLQRRLDLHFNGERSLVAQEERIAQTHSRRSHSRALKTLELKREFKKQFDNQYNDDS